MSPKKGRKWKEEIEGEEKEMERRRNKLAIGRARTSLVSSSPAPPFLHHEPASSEGSANAKDVVLRLLGVHQLGAAKGSSLGVASSCAAVNRPEYDLSVSRSTSACAEWSSPWILGIWHYQRN